MSKYTDTSIRRAMMEQVCQGLEGHHPKDYKAHKSSRLFHVAFECAKCKLYVHVRDIELQLEDETFDFPDARETPPLFYWGK